MVVQKDHACTMETAGEMPPRALSLRRYASEDMHSVGLDSPRGTNRKCRSWPNYEGSDGWAASFSSFIGPFKGAVLGGETLPQLTTSWFIPSEVLLAWRMVIFLYMSGTCIFLGQRGSLTRFTLSAEIYLLQSVAFTLILFPSFLLRRGGGTGSLGSRGLPQTISSFRRRPVQSPTEPGGEGCCASWTQALFTITTILMQSVAALVIFWDTMYWTRFHFLTAPTVDLMLLHSYNIAPLVVELLFGNIEFALVYFFPSFLFLGTYLGTAAQGSVLPNKAQKSVQTASDWVGQLFSGATTPLTYWVFYMALYAITCGAVFFIQRGRRCVGTYMLQERASKRGGVSASLSNSTIQLELPPSGRDNSPP